MKIENKFLKLLMCLLLLQIGGCKVELFGALSEQEANEMMAILLQNGVDADKLPGKKGTVQITVDKSDMALAIQMLKDNGYPKEEFSDLGSIFTKEGLISSPLEERARYVHAVSQELSETLSNLDGVIVARVHIVLPEVDSTGDVTTPSSASVFIKHAEGYKMKNIVPEIRLLVNNSIEGLDYERISVALFPSKVKSFSKNGKDRMVRVLSMNMTPSSANKLYLILTIFAFMLVAGISLGIYSVSKSKS